MALPISVAPVLAAQGDSRVMKDGRAGSGVRLGVVFAAVVAVLAAAIPARAADPLDGTFWRVTGFADGPSKLAGDIRFDAGEVSGATSCNFFGGTYAVDDGGRLTIKLGRMTRRGCLGEAAETERHYLEAIEKTERYVRDGETLRFAASDGTAVAHLALAPTIALTGGRQKIVSYLHDGGLYSVAPDSGPWLKLANGRLEGATGCAPLGGSYIEDGTTIRIMLEAKVAQGDGCTGSLARQDAAIRAALPLAGTFDTNRNLIRLLQADGATAVLWLTPEENGG